MEDAIREYMTRAALPIIVQRGDTVETGTGTIFRLSDRYYVVTADHVLDDDDLEHVASPLGRQNAQIMTWGEVARLNYKSEYDLDLTSIELKTPEMIAALSQSYKVLTLDQVGLPSEDAQHWVVGFPSELASATSVAINQTPFRILTKMLAETPEVPANAKPSDPRFDLFFALDRDGTLDDGSTAPVPDLDGVSGASIWEVSDYQGPVRTPGKALKVIGVQKAAMPGSYIRATRWELVVPLLYHLEQHP
jgi:hypothetical protein